MDSDRTEGKAKDIKGSIKRQVGEWTDDEQAQQEGALDQAEGKAQSTWGKVKDAVRDVVDEAKKKSTDVDKNRREKDVA